MIMADEEYVRSIEEILADEERDQEIAAAIYATPPYRVPTDVASVDYSIADEQTEWIMQGLRSAIIELGKVHHYGFESRFDKPHWVWQMERALDAAIMRVAQWPILVATIDRLEPTTGVTE